MKKKNEKEVLQEFLGVEDVPGEVKLFAKQLLKLLKEKKDGSVSWSATETIELIERQENKRIPLLFMIKSLETLSCSFIDFHSFVQGVAGLGEEEKEEAAF